MKSEIKWGGVALLAVAIWLGGGYLVNTRNQNVAPGKSDNLVREITSAADEIVVLKSAPNPDGKPPKRREIGRVAGAQTETFLALVRLQDNELKSFERASDYRVRFLRKGKILGALDFYFDRGWGYAQEPADEADAPFKKARVIRPTFAPRLREFLDTLKSS